MKFKSAKVILASALGLGVSVPAFAAGLKDTNIPWAQSAIEKFVANGAVTGYPDHTFRPNNPISRAEFTTIVNKAFGTYDSNASANFKDVKSNQWFYKQVASAKEVGYVTGFPNNTFAPNKSITRAEAAVMVAKLLHLDTTNASVNNFKDTNLPQWAAASINALGDLKVLNGYTDGYFRASNNITRAEATVMLNTALSSTQPQTNPTTTDTVQVSITGTVTANGSVVAGADVKAFKAGDYTLQKEATTDSSGNFKLDVTDGSYYVTAVKDNMVGYAGNVTATKANGASVTIKLEKGIQVSGNLFDVNGRALQNATYAFGVDGVLFTGVTDNNGYYKILLPMSKTYTFSAVNPISTSDGLHTINSAVEIGTKDQTLKDMSATFAAGSTGGGGGGGGGNDTSSSNPSTVITLSADRTISASDLSGKTLVNITGCTVTLNGNMLPGVNFVVTNGATLKAANGTVTIPGNVTMDSNSNLSGINVQGTTTIQ